MKKTAMITFALALVGTQALAQSAGGFKLISAKRVTTSENALESAEQKSMGKPSADRKTLSIPAKSARLVVHTGPDNDMLSFRIQGLRNPTLVVKPGAVLRILFVNSDEDMFHNLRFGAGKAPFPAKPGHAGTVGTADLPHEASGKLFGQELVIKAPMKPGAYTYVCTIAGHAAAGMYGTLQVR